MKKILSNLVLSVFVIWQIFSLAVYAETPEVKLDNLATAKIEAPVETEVESKLEEKVPEVKDEVVEINEVSINKELQINNKVKNLKELKELKVEELKPVVIEKPIVSDDQIVVGKNKCTEASLPKNTKWVLKSQIDYVTDAQKNVWRYVEWEKFNEAKGMCQWTCNKDEWYIYNKSSNSCVKLQVVDDDQIVAKVKCTEKSLPEDSEWVIKSQFDYVTSKYALKNVWRYVEWENFDESNWHCEWTCNKDKWYTVNEEKNGCQLVAAEKKPCSNKPENTKWMIMTKIDYFNWTLYKDISWRYVSFKEFDMVKHVCTWTCDEKNWFTLNEKKDWCIEKSDKLEVKMDFNRPNCSADSQINCLGFVKDVKYWEVFQLPESESLSFTLTYVDHNWTVKETRSAKIIWYYMNDEYLQKCEWAEKCGPARIYEPWEEVKITESVTFHAIWEDDDLNVTVKDTSSYRQWSYRYDFVNWNKSENDTYKAWDTFKLLEDTTLVANYNRVYVWWNWGGNWWNWWNNNQNEEVVLPWQVDWCTVVDSTYDDELNEAFLYACENWITSLKDVNEAKLNDKITRAEMAKFITQFALVSLKKTPSDINKDCSNFADSIASYSNEMKNYMTLACKFEYMWVTPLYTAMSDFMPNKNLSRAEFGTVLSRILWWNKYEWSNVNYYTNHLNALKNAGIIKDINPNIMESRWYVMLMLYRAAKDQWLIK